MFGFIFRQRWLVPANRPFWLIGGVRLVSAACLVGILAVTAHARTSPPALGLTTNGQLSRGRLPNGLRVIIREDPGVPAVAVNAWVHAGGKDETDDLAGYSHYLEHLTFRGSTRRAPLQGRLEIFNVGGDNSANTYYDRTTYYNVVDKAHLGLALDSLADVLFDATLPAEGVEAERQVVSEELRQTLDRPDTQAIHTLMAMVFKGHPYARPVIGNFETLNGLRQEDFRAYYERMYVPNNVVLAVNGNLDTAETWKLIKQTFGRYPAGRSQTLKPPNLRAFTGFKQQTLHLDQQRQTVLLGFLGPGFRHPDRPAAHLLAMLLGGDQASRLHQRLVVSDSAASFASAGYTPFEQHGIMTYSAAPLAGGSVAELATLILEEIHRLQTEPLSPADLMRLQRQLDRQDVFSGQDALSPAYELGEAELYGDLRYAADYTAWRKSVTPVDIQRVARQYLRPENLNLVYSLPKEAPAPDEAAQLRVKLARDRLALPMPKPIDWSATWLGLRPTALPKADRAGTALTTPAQLWSEANGLRVVYERRTRVPLVAVELALPVGSRHDPIGAYGTVNVLSQALMMGTKQYDQIGIARMTSEWGGFFGPAVYRDSLRVRALVSREDAPAALKLLADLVREPLLSDRDVISERDKALSHLQRQADDVGLVAGRTYREAMYAGSGLAHQPIGTEADLARLTPEQVRAFARTHLVPRGAVLAVAGDATKAEVETWLQQAGLLDWQGGPTPPLPGDRPTPQSGTIRIPRPSQQAQVLVGFPAPARGSADEPALQILAGMAGFQAFVDLVYGKPLAYRTGANLDRYRDAGDACLYIGTAVANRTEAVQEMVSRWMRLIEAPIDPQAFADAKARYIGRQALTDQQVMNRATGLASFELSGQGFAAYDAQVEAIAGLTLNNVTQAAKRWIDPTKLLTVVVGGEPSGE